MRPVAGLEAVKDWVSDAYTFTQRTEFEARASRRLAPGSTIRGVTAACDWVCQRAGLAPGQCPRSLRGSWQVRGQAPCFDDSKWPANTGTARRACIFRTESLLRFQHNRDTGNRGVSDP